MTSQSPADFLSQWLPFLHPFVRLSLTKRPECSHLMFAHGTSSLGHVYSDPRQGGSHIHHGCLSAMSFLLHWNPLVLDTSTGIISLCGINSKRMTRSGHHFYFRKWHLEPSAPSHTWASPLASSSPSLCHTMQCHVQFLTFN